MSKQPEFLGKVSIFFINMVFLLGIVGTLYDLKIPVKG